MGYYQIKYDLFLFLKLADEMFDILIDLCDTDVEVGLVR